MAFTFDTNDVPEREEYTPLPAGDYTMIFTEVELKETKANAETGAVGKMLVFTGEIQDEQFKGRKHYVRLNVENANETAVKIAYQEFAEIVKACGKVKVDGADFEDAARKHLLNIRMAVTMGVQPAKGAYGPSNTVKKYAKYGAQAATATGAATTATGAVTKRPWAK